MQSKDFPYKNVLLLIEVLLMCPLFFLGRGTCTVANGHANEVTA